MSGDEIFDLLDVIVACDRRTIGDADLLVWQSGVGDLEFEDARDAVLAHNRESDEWLKPVHVRRRVKAARTARLATVRQPAPPQNPDDPVAYLHAYRAGIRAIATPASEQRAIGGTA